jgi:phosphohistidine phosphatase
MTMLTVMRHAKSSWGDASLEDFDRPLNDRGHKSARLVGREAAKRKIAFDRVFASTAMRVRETLDGFAEGYGSLPKIEFADDLYGASLGHLVDRVRAIPDLVHAPLMVGHNPGLHRLVLQLTKDDDPLRQRLIAKYPTGTLTLITLPAGRWDETEAGTGSIAELILPRDLDD